MGLRLQGPHCYMPCMAGGPPRLLVVDDDPAIVKLVMLAMSARGYAVEGAASVVQALGLFDAAPFDVVLTDKNLKGATGLELVDTLAKRAPATAVVLMTAYPEGTAGRLAALDGYLGKPFRSLDVLAETLQDARDRRARALERQRLVGKLGEVQTSLESATVRSPSR